MAGIAPRHLWFILDIDILKTGQKDLSEGN